MISAAILAAHLDLDPFGGWALALPLAGLFALATVLGYARLAKPLSPPKRRILRLLRGAAVAAVVFVLFRPTLVHVSTQYERPMVVLLADTSRSMGIRDESPAGAAAAEGSPAMISRAEALAGELKFNEPLLLELAGKFDLVAYLFGERLIPVADALSEPVSRRDPQVLRDQVAAMVAMPLNPQAQATRLGDHLAEACEAHPHRRLLGAVLLTDGQSCLSQISPEDAARRLAQRGVPVHSGAYGAAEPTGAVRDSAAVDIQAPATLFAGNRADVVGEFVFHGLKGETVTVQLLADGKPVARQSVQIQSHRHIERIRLPYEATEPGSRRLELVADAVAGEQSDANNRIWTYVDVVKGGMKLLLVRGYLRPEGAHLSRALRRAGEFDLDTIVLGTRDQAAAMLPQTPAQWAAYKVVLFDDVPRDFLSSDQAAALIRAVADGTGFVMLGGEHAFASGGYTGSELAAVLPVQLAAGQGQVERPVRFRPTAAGLQMSILQLEGQESGKVWDSLPPLAGANVVGPAKAAAEILAVGEGGETLLAGGQYQRGRVAALTVDTTWRWAMEGRDDPPGKYHRRFWRQLLLFLAGQDAASQSSVWVTTGRPRYGLPELLSRRQSVVVTAGVPDGQGGLLTDATCSLRLHGPGPADVRDLELAVRGDTYETVVPVSAAGDYRLELTVFRDGRKAGDASTRFVVFEPDLELERPQANLELLASLARMSGGTAVTAGHMEGLLRDLLSRDVPNIVRVEQRRGLWDNGAVLAVFAGLLTAEWILRRRWGLV